MRRSVLQAPISEYVDERYVRDVTKYADVADVAIDELECGHKVRCGRVAGGRKVQAHAEFCAECANAG
jgi:hypothetical protein